MLACADAPLRPTSPHAPFLLASGDRVAALVAEPSDSLGREALRASARYEVPGVVRQSALDWLDQRQQFDRMGTLRVVVRIRELRLRSAISARWFDFVAGEDRLGAGVSVLREGDLLKTFSVRVTSRLGGPTWRDPEDRMRRLCQQLGRQVADGL